MSEMSAKEAVEIKINNLVEGNYWTNEITESYFETVKQALEKQVPKKPIIKPWRNQELKQGCGADTNCPNCNHVIFNGFYYKPWNESQKRHKHCEECGQEIDWSDSNE